MEKEIPAVVSSAASRLTKAGIPMHSLLVAKSSELIAEIYWKPFRKDTLHRMYSCTKSFVSLAIGTLLGQWKLSLDDRIINHFPDMIPSAVPEELASMTIRDMLMKAENQIMSPHGSMTGSDLSSQLNLITIQALSSYMTHRQRMFLRLW